MAEHNEVTNMQVMQVQAVTLDRVRKLLKWWGEYQRAMVKADYRLGYPQTSPCIHIGETRSELAPLPKPTVMVQKIDDAMEALGKFRADGYLALRYKYEYQYIDKDAAREMNNISRATYQGLVKEGEHFIAGRIL